ncbi:hypothetical protein BDZ91DRAFT_752484 [Kalaharituber pfeilii]|nr:hypothetical protein BDZ91DRAFT_752484 [Kalaharituber pfeilii]
MDGYSAARKLEMCEQSARGRDQPSRESLRRAAHAPLLIKQGGAGPAEWNATAIWYGAPGAATGSRCAAPTRCGVLSRLLPRARESAAGTDGQADTDRHCALLQKHLRRPAMPAEVQARLHLEKTGLEQHPLLPPGNSMPHTGGTVHLVRCKQNIGITPSYQAM